MAIRGRRQPFAPIIKRLIGAAAAPVGRLVKPTGAFAAQAVANTAHRLPSRVVIAKRYPFATPSSPPIGQVVVPAGRFAAQAAANVAHRLPFRVIIGKRYPYTAPTAPVGRLIVPFGRFAAQAAANTAHRLPFPVIINMPTAPRRRRANVKLPFLPRVPDATDPNAVRRGARHTEIISAAWNSLLAAGYIRSEGLGYKIVGGAFESTRAPRQEDDASIRAQVGSSWVDTVAEEAYICISNALGLAVWKKVT